MFKLPDMTYDYDALAPHISREIMELHHKKHHQAYVDKLNKALESVSGDLAELSLEDILRDLDSLSDDIRTTVRNNGGGHYNHSLFWRVMSPAGGGTPGGDLLAGLEDRYGSFDDFVATFNDKAAALFGSGWVWLQPDLSLVSLPNQDNPLMAGGAEPLMGLDVWEHAYYLDYKNVRADYIKAWWNVVDWQYITNRYQSA